MSANFHTPLPTPFSITQAVVESPLAELDQAITNLTIGADDISQLNLGAFNAKTISSGAITGDKTLVTVDTEASAATDDLDTISSPTGGDFMIIKIANNSRVVTIRNNGGGSGNIRTHNGLNVVLSDTNQLATLVYNGSNWVVLPDVHQSVAFDVQTDTISGGVITYKGTNMIIDTEASAASDDLDTINGGVDGAVLFLKSANSSRDVVIKHGTGNIFASTLADTTIDTVNRFVMLVYNATNSVWHTVLAPTLFKATQSGTTTTINNNMFGVPYQGVVTAGHPLASTTQPYFDFAPLVGRRQVRTLQGCDTTLEGAGFGTLTVSGTPSNSFGVGGSGVPGSFVRFQSGGSSGNLGGIISPFTITSMQCFPTLRILFRTYSSIAVCRFWIGLSSAAIGNTDSPSSAATHFIGVRYSTVVPDSFWQFVTSDGATTTASSTGVGAGIDANYELIINGASTNAATIYFRNMNSATFASLSTSTTLPADTTALGLDIRVETREAVAKSLLIYSVSLYH